MNARDVLELFDADLDELKSTVVPALTAAREQAMQLYAEQDQNTRILAGLVAGLVLGKVVSRLGR
jgi:hypothetical protein